MSRRRTPRQQQYFKEKARKRAVKLLNELNALAELVPVRELRLMRNETEFGLYLRALERVASDYPALLESSCTQPQWERIAQDLSEPQPSLF